jgi:hypothetical protein
MQVIRLYAIHTHTHTHTQTIQIKLGNLFIYLLAVLGLNSAPHAC